jgi:hypothetical protein
MGLVVVERHLEKPTPFEEIQALEDNVAWCLEQNGVLFERTYFSRDRCHMICIYEAPDAEAVRTTQRKGGLPFESIWSGQLLVPPEQPPSSGGFETVVVQRVLPTPHSPDQVAALMDGAQGCMSLYRATQRASYLGRDGMRLVCVFEAPDAEAVRAGSLKAGIPLVRAWSSTLHEPQDS